MRSPSLSSGNVELGAMRSDEQGVECEGTCDDEGDWARTETNNQLRRQRVLSSNDSRNGSRGAVKKRGKISLRHETVWWLMVCG